MTTKKTLILLSLAAILAMCCYMLGAFMNTPEDAPAARSAATALAPEQDEATEHRRAKRPRARPRRAVLSRSMAMPGVQRQGEQLTGAQKYALAMKELAARRRSLNSDYYSRQAASAREGQQQRTIRGGLQRLQEDLPGGLKVLSSGCRGSMCRVEVEVGEGEPMHKFSRKLMELPEIRSCSIDFMPDQQSRDGTRRALVFLGCGA